MDWGFLFRVIVFPGFVFIFFLTIFCDWFERKMEARMQNRMGPSYTGPFGLFQPIADFIKMISKEDVVPLNAKELIFRFAPILAFSTFIFAFLFLPIDGIEATLPSFEGDLILVLTLISAANFLLFLSGWSSTNPFSIIGATRVLTQFLGYEMPLFLLASSSAIISGELSISGIVLSQKIPFFMLAPWSFIFFIMVLQAELEKDPFDAPHAETEIVAGYETEYTGRRLAFLKLAEDVHVVLGAALAAELFLGGPRGPILFGPPFLWLTSWFILKTLAVIFLSEYLTCIFARLRIDQVIIVNWRILLPLSILSLSASFILSHFGVSVK